MGDESIEKGPTTRELRDMLERQYRAALDMHRSAVDQCPAELWADGEHVNAFWQIAYHALFFTHLYLMPHADDYDPWPGHQTNVQHEDGLTGEGDPESSAPLLPRPYTREEVLAYWDFCDVRLGEWLDSIDLASSASGFYWYPVSKLEHQLVNIRHLQHHTAQLADRLRKGADRGVAWAGSRPVG